MISLPAVSNHEINPSHHETIPETVPAADRPVCMCSKASAAIMMHGLRDFTGQAAARSAGLAIFTLSSAGALLPLRILAGVSGAMAAGTQGFLMASQQIGTETRTQQSLVAFCTLASALAGGGIAALGCTQPVLTLGMATLGTVAASYLRKTASGPEALETCDKAKAGVFLLTTVAGLTLASTVDKEWIRSNTDFPARTLGVVLESFIIELCKSSFEKVGPSIDRKTLTFEGRVRSGLMGMAPYVIATGILNGYVSGTMQPGYDTHEFNLLIAPLIIGAVANAIRGISNAAAVYSTHGHEAYRRSGSSEVLRGHMGPVCPDLPVVYKKSCIRFFLSTCRNAVYARLRDHGLSIVLASSIAQTVYAGFAQYRDLIYDVAEGDGWTEPVLLSRPADASV